MHLEGNRVSGQLQLCSAALHNFSRYLTSYSAGDVAQFLKAIVQGTLAQLLPCWRVASTGRLDSRSAIGGRLASSTSRLTGNSDTFSANPHRHWRSGDYVVSMTRCEEG